MNWTEPNPPTEGESYYDHTKLETPLGKFIIEWKSWKESPSYDIMLGADWIGCEYELEDAKQNAEYYLINRFKELEVFLGENKIGKKE